MQRPLAVGATASALLAALAPAGSAAELPDVRTPNVSAFDLVEADEVDLAPGLKVIAIEVAAEYWRVLDDVEAGGPASQSGRLASGVDSSSLGQKARIATAVAEARRSSGLTVTRVDRTFDIVRTTALSRGGAR